MTKCVKISLNPTFRDYTYDISMCLNEWIIMRTGLLLDAYVKYLKDKGSYAVYVVYGDDKNRDILMDLLRKERTDKVIQSVKQTDVYGELGYPIYPKPTSRKTVRQKYYCAIRKWFRFQVRKYEYETYPRLCAMKDQDEFSNVIIEMDFND